MTRKPINRRAAAILTAALTLSAAGPAVARPIDSVGPYSPYTAVTIPQQQPATQAVASHSGGSLDFEYLLIGVGGAVLVTSGAAVATHRRRHARITSRAGIAA